MISQRLVHRVAEQFTAFFICGRVLGVRTTPELIDGELKSVMPTELAELGYTRLEYTHSGA